MHACMGARHMHKILEVYEVALQSSFKILGKYKCQY